MRKPRLLKPSAIAIALGLACAMPVHAQTSASSESAAGQPAPSEPSAATGATSASMAGSAVSGTAGSGGQGAGADMPSAAAGASAPAGFGASAGLDRPVDAESSRANYWGWLAALGLLVLVILAALRVRRELRRGMGPRST